MPASISWDGRDSRDRHLSTVSWHLFSSCGLALSGITPYPRNPESAPHLSSSVRDEATASEQAYSILSVTWVEPLVRNRSDGSG